MKALYFAKKYIHFNRISLVSGAFDLSKYPMLGKPLSELDNIHTKTLVVFKASGCMGTVYLQIAMAKRILCDVGDMYFVAQTDDDAKGWGVERGGEFILGIDDIYRLRMNDKNWQTQGRWMFRHKWLIITGPSKTARQSRQVRFVLTDESHLEEQFEDGALKEFDDRRQSAGWMGQSVHATTAPDSGREVDVLFHQGKQNEWHFRCVECQKLFWPLWRKVTSSMPDVVKLYGRQIFHWKENGTIDEKLDSVRVECPHCGAVHCDTTRDRRRLNQTGDYIEQNPTGSKGINSYRWGTTAAFWLEWKEKLKKYLEAIEAAKLGNLSMLENFCKKQLCFSWTPTIPDFGDGIKSSGYRIGDEWEVEEAIKILTADFQAGMRGEGSHIWALVTQWDRAGNSRRLAYRKLLTWPQLHAMAEEFKIPEGKFGRGRPGSPNHMPGIKPHVAVDSGHDNRTVFQQCSFYGWMATRGSDEKEILHTKKSGDGIIQFPMPYSQPERQNGNVGKRQPEKLRTDLGGILPSGWAFCIVMANPTLYGYLYALQNGTSGRTYGIPEDMPEEYTSIYQAFIPFLEADKKTNIIKQKWKKIRPEHPWDCEIQALMMAIRLGYFPLALPEKVIDLEPSIS